MIVKFQQFILEFKETERNTPTLYKDDNVEIKVVKTLDSARQQNINTNWCSSSKIGFGSHDKTANMYRFNFSDGYKLRLTWDYITSDASELGYSGGTHWGQGGIVDGEELSYSVLRPEDESEPFLFDYKKDDYRKIMVDRIESLPQKAINAVHDYQEKNYKEKSEKIINTYKEIEKIKIKDVILENSYDFYNYFNVIVDYKGQSIEFTFSAYKTKKYISLNTNKLERSIKNNYIGVGRTLDNYLIDKISEFCKKNSIKIYE